MDGFKSIAQKAVVDGVIPGAVFLAQNAKGSFSYSEAVSGPDGAYNEDCKLEIASLTKLLTTIAALQLVDEGLITLDQDAIPYIPDFAELPVLDDILADGTVITHKRREGITIHQLLTHTAGAAYMFNDKRLSRYVAIQNGSLRQDGTIAGIFNYPLSYEPRAGWLYSSSMDRVGQIIEKVSGKSLEIYFSEKIFKPLGITSASFWHKSDLPMAVRNEKGELVPSPNVTSYTTGLKECFGGQGLVMNMKDYMKILHSLLVNDGTLLRAETVDKLFAPQLSPISKEALLKQLENPDWAVGHLPPTTEYDWAYAGLLITGDKHPFRRKGAVLWSGAPSLFWFIDRVAGVCGVFGTQVLPASDTTVRPVIKAFEEAVYKAAAGL